MSVAPKLSLPQQEQPVAAAVVDSVVMPSGYDIYADFYSKVTSTETMERLLDITGALSVISKATILAPVDAVRRPPCAPSLDRHYFIPPAIITTREHAHAPLTDQSHDSCIPNLISSCHGYPLLPDVAADGCRPLRGWHRRWAWSQVKHCLKSRTCRA